MMRYIHDLSGSSYNEVECAIFLIRLPAEVRTGLANSLAVNNDAFAVETNSILEEYLLARSRAVAPSVVALMELPKDVEMPPALVAEAEQAAASVNAVNRPPQCPIVETPYLCFIHARYGKQAYSCRSQRCPMRNQVVKRPGNDGAGCQ